MRPVLVSLLLIAACNWRSPTEPIAAQCTSPAPFYTAGERAPGYIVMFRDGVDVAATVKRYEARYRFRALSVWEGVGGLYLDVPMRTIEALRCEPEVKLIEENAVGHTGGIASSAASPGT